MLQKLIHRCLWLAFLAPAAFAQFDSAAVLGTVRDSTSAVLAGATVELLNQATGITAKTKTDANGEFIFNNVKIGLYSVSASSAGFSRTLAKDITVNVNARQRVDLVLQLGAVAESVEVTAAASLLQTDSSERGQIVNRTAIVDLSQLPGSGNDALLSLYQVVYTVTASGSIDAVQLRVAGRPYGLGTLSGGWRIGRSRPVGPGGLQLSDILRIDLIEGRKARAGKVAAVHGPVGCGDNGGRRLSLFCTAFRSSLLRGTGLQHGP